MGSEGFPGRVVTPVGRGSGVRGVGVRFGGKGVKEWGVALGGELGSGSGREVGCASREGLFGGQHEVEEDGL